METRTRRRPQPCGWCGQPVADSGVGRRRRYCKQSCRQRAYEQRSVTQGTSVPADAVILGRAEADDLIDRLFTLRCAAEDVATAVEEKAPHAELAALCEELLARASEAERLR
ncbi:hypothetical protein [Williamsia deligens]|uniref:Recombinase zinc beta ribbon domain-containing protein n=1 Tax=Williamsia deligens TaxID=321325 RepID=A0ABW3GAU3_9NOCA|nr:hypothetical protein [Williamsia deligens]